MILRRSNTNNRRLRTKKGSQANQLLELRVRRDSVKQKRANKINAVLIKFIFFGLLVTAALVGGRMLLDKFFFTNPNYNVEHLEVSLDQVMTLEELKKLTGLHEGTNIFKVDLSAAEKILSDVPEVKKAHIERLLPNTIQISLERRIPILRLVASHDEAFVPGHSFVIDQSGMVMVPKNLDSTFLELPLLQGIDGAHVTVGKPIQDEKFSFAVALFTILSTYQHSELIMIRSLDLSRDYCAIITDQTDAHYIFSEENVPAQVERLQKLLAHCQATGRQIETANLILEHNTPVTFRSNINSSESVGKTAQFTTPNKTTHRR